MTGGVGADLHINEAQIAITTQSQDVLCKGVTKSLKKTFFFKEKNIYIFYKLKSETIR